MRNNAAMDIAVWIAEALDRNPRKTQAGLARALGRDASSVSRLLKGKRQVKANELSKIIAYIGENPPVDVLRGLVQSNGAIEEGVDLAEIERASFGLAEAPRSFTQSPGRTSRAEALEFEGSEFAAIPRYDARLSAGHGSIIDPQAEPIGFHLIEAQWLNAITRAAPAHMAVIRVAGDSMEDTLSDGDWVLLDRTQTRAAQEGVYALQIDDTTWVKRLTLNLRDRLIRVVSDNPKYPFQDLPPDDLTVIGRVVCIVARRV